MDRLCWTFAILCVFAVSCSAAAVHENIADTSKNAINGVNRVMDLYYKVLKDVPLSTLNEKLNNLEKYHNDYSSAAAGIISEIKGHMSNGIDAYKRASQIIYDWCNFAVKRLESYIQLFDAVNPPNVQKQKEILIEMLDEGLRKMQTAQDELGKSSSSFNGAAGRLTVLKAQFSRDFDSSSSYFRSQIKKKRAEGYGISAIFGPLGLAIAAGVLEGKLIPEIKAKIKNVEHFYGDIDKIVAAASVGIDQTKENLKRELQTIGDLKVTAKETSTFVSLDYIAELRDTIVQSAKTLIAKCYEYMRDQKQL